MHRGRERLATANRVTLTQLAAELALSRRGARRLVRRYAYAAQPRGDPATYDARFIDFIRAVRGQPHRPLEPVQDDWLARYLKENP